MNQFWSPVVAKLTPYIAGEQPKVDEVVKLNTNENPFGPSPKVLAAMQAALSDAVRLYPDPEAELLVDAIAQYYHLDADQIFVGNGSDEVLAFCFQALLKQRLPLFFPSITYNFYSSYCHLFEIEYRHIDLRANFQLDLGDFPVENGGIIFANPNAPTGIAVALAKIETLLQRNTQSVVVVDEAYVDFGADTAVPLIKKYPNLLVVQTFSKSRSLAGMRAGFAMGDANLIEALQRVKNSFNAYPLNRVTIAGAAAAMQDEEYFEKTRCAVIANRELVTTQLKKLGFEVLDSKANFIFCRHPKFEGADLAQSLRQKKVLVRHFKQQSIDQWLRISIGTDEECQALIAAMSAIVENQ